MKYLDITNFINQPYRQDQVDNAIFKNFITDIDQIQTLPKQLRQNIKARFTFPTIEVVKETASTDNSVKKVLFQTKTDSQTFESVLLMHERDRQTVCVSTQIGCPLNCAFCATGKIGYIRNLDYKEIIDQVLYFSRVLKAKGKRITNVVYMGMGEPFLNLENTLASISILNDLKQFNLGARNITISTVGIIEPMKEFFSIYPQVNLAISLHSAIDEKRQEIMPIAQKVTLEELKDYIRFHIERYNRRISLEHILINGFNDTLEDIEALTEFIKNISESSQKLLHVNLIPLNVSKMTRLRPSTRKKLTEFKDHLIKNGINVTIRKSLGQENNAACGMLKGETIL